jgi:hypothetical protein
MIKFMKKIYVWLPEDSPMRGEVINFLNHLKSQRPR